MTKVVDEKLFQTETVRFIPPKEAREGDVLEHMKKVLEDAGYELIEGYDVYEEIINNELYYIVNKEYDKKFDDYSYKEVDQMRKLVSDYSWDLDLGFITEEVRFFAYDVLKPILGYRNLGIEFDPEKLVAERYEISEEKYNELIENDPPADGSSIKPVVYSLSRSKDKFYIEDINERLYRNYLLNFEYDGDSFPVCYDEFLANELEEEEILQSMKGIMI